MLKYFFGLYPAFSEQLLKFYFFSDFRNLFRNLFSEIFISETRFSDRKLSEIPKSEYSGGNSENFGSEQKSENATKLQLMAGDCHSAPLAALVLPHYELTRNLASSPLPVQTISDR